MRNRYGFIVAAALLFVGAGCSGSPKQAPADDDGAAQEAVGAQGAMGGVNEDARRMAPTGDLDADIQALLADAEVEKTEALGAGVEANAAGSEDAGLDSLINGDYEVK